MTFSYRHPVTGEFKTVPIPALPAGETIKIRIEFENESKSRIHYVDPETSEVKTIDPNCEE